MSSGTGGRWPVVVAAGVAAGIHIWKVPPLVATIGEQFGVSLVEAGVLLGIVQIAGMLGGLAVGLLAEAIGFRRCAASGLVVLALESAAGAFVSSFGLLLGLRAIESVGFLLVVVAGPGLIRRVAPTERLGIASGAWASFQAISAFGTLAVSAAFGAALSVQGSWLATAALSLAAAVLLVLAIPADPARADAVPHGIGAAVVRSVRTWGIWVAGGVFLAYAAAWMAVLGFLPTILAAAGLDARMASLLSGVASGVNLLGAIGAGWLLQRGVPARRLLAVGVVTMAVTSVVVFAIGLPPAGQFAAVLVFSAVGGLVPGTLIRLALALTPEGGSTPASVGITMQCSNAGMFAGPPIVAALTTATGTWATTWWFTVAATVIALLLALLLGDRRHGLALGARRG